MHGLGNDFMVIDGINQLFNPLEAPLVKWADRHTGVGFDQLLLVEQSNTDGVDFRYRIFNSDGSEVEQCGNGARCFAQFVIDRGLTNKKEIKVETARGIIIPKLMDNGLITVNMGKPRFQPNEIPFISADDESSIQLTHRIPVESELINIFCVNMGNPHAVIVVDDCKTAPVTQWGKEIESHPQFPNRVNVGFMQIVDNQHIRLRVYERGVGETQACGTGACAATVAGIKLGLLKAHTWINVHLLGGSLLIMWQDGDDVLMAGPAETVFEGELKY